MEGSGRLSARFNYMKLSKKQSALLREAVKRFNRKADTITAVRLPKADYKELKEIIFNKNDLNRQINRLNRLSVPGNDKVFTNKYGVKYLKWEVRENQYQNQRVNTWRRKEREKKGYTKEIIERFMQNSHETILKDRTGKIATFKTRQGINAYISAGNRLATSNPKAYYLSIMRENVLDALDDWPNLPQIETLKNIISKLDIETLIDVLDIAPELTPDTVYNLLDNDNDIIENADYLVTRWMECIAVAQSQQT